MLTPRLQRPAARDERGAVAVMFAVTMSVLLLVMTAIAVDLGNARSTKLSVQTSVDVSAISAGALLPVTTDADKLRVYDEVAAYLNREGNRIPGRGTILATQLHDGDQANGEVVFVANPQTEVLDTMRVVAPRAQVDFGFAAAFGPDEVSVGGEATVQVRTPLPEMQNVLPVWLPSTCVYGPLMGDAGSTPPPPPDASPSYTLNTPQVNKNSSWTTGTVSPASASYAASGVLADITIDDLPAGKLGAIIRMTFGNTQYVDYRVTWPNPTAAGASRTVSIDLDDPEASRVPSGATVTNPDESWTVTSTVGKWEIWPLIPDGSTPPSLPLTSPVSEVKFPGAQGSDKRQGVFQVTGGGAVACSESQRGNFGQLDSPRTSGPHTSGQKQTVYALNVAYGLDHTFTTFPDPASFECAGDDVPEGALVDDGPSTDGRNCLYVDPGNDPQGLTDGMLGGGRIVQGEGRLEKPTNPRCGRPAFKVGSRSYNNDTLSCFLKPGYTLADIAKDTGVPADALDKSVFDSPRFFWVAVVHQGDRMLKKYLAIKTFAPVFLTDETVSSGATADNGLKLNGGGKVRSMQLFGFNVNALPVEPNADTTDFEPGSRKVVRLIN